MEEEVIEGEVIEEGTPDTPAAPAEESAEDNSGIVGLDPDAIYSLAGRELKGSEVATHLERTAFIESQEQAELADALLFNMNAGDEGKQRIYEWAQQFAAESQDQGDFEVPETLALDYPEFAELISAQSKEHRAMKAELTSMRQHNAALTSALQPIIGDLQAKAATEVALTELSKAGIKATSEQVMAAMKAHKGMDPVKAFLLANRTSTATKPGKGGPSPTAAPKITMGAPSTLPMDASPQEIEQQFHAMKRASAGVTQV